MMMFLIERSKCDNDDVLMMMFLIKRSECDDDDVFMMIFLIKRSECDDDDVSDRKVKVLNLLLIERSKC